MTIRFDETKKTYIVSYSARHTKTKQPRSLVRKGIKSLAEATRVEKKLVKELRDSFHKETVPTWQVLVQQFITFSAEKGLHAKTVDNRRVCLEAHTFQTWGNLTIDKISAIDIRNLISSKLGHRSASQQKNVLQYIRLAFEYAVESSYVPRNPAPRIKFRIGEKIKTVLTEDQAKILLMKARSLESEWYLVWSMALYTGMRNGELYALTWDKVNLEQRILKVDSSWNSKSEFKETKSGDDRIVEIAPELLQMLKESKIQSFGSNFVLPRIDKWDRGEQARELRMFLLGLGLPRIRFHDLRASWATIMISKGIPPIKVMAMGGWKDLKTMQFYIRKAGVDIKGITNNLTLHFHETEGRILKLDV
jgi:integrase